MLIDIKSEGKFKYIETGGDGTPLVLLHGLMGALSNFKGIIKKFSESHNVVVPMLPIFDMPMLELGVMGLVRYVEEFITYKGYGQVHLLGNSLGGHIGQLYALENADKVQSLILTGSSGLFESAFGNSFPKRGNRQYIQEKVESVFYNKEVADKDLVDEVFTTVNDRLKALRIVKTAKSAVRHNLGDKLHMLTLPVLLIWGREDEVTPAWVGEKFHELLPNSELHILEKCGHAPMMEHPDRFNYILLTFLDSIETSAAVS